MTRDRLPPITHLSNARIASVIALAQLSFSANAHDTWFSMRAARLPGALVMTLGTGSQFPTQEFSIDAEHLREHGCSQAGHAVALQVVGKGSVSLLMRAHAPNATPVTCWSQLTPFEIELAPDKVGVYLDDINASPVLRELWAVMQRRGLPWKERYVKSARVEVAAGTEADANALPALPVPMGLDVVLQSGLQPLRTGDALVVQVLRDGVPLPDFQIELRGTSPAQARWFKTDSMGRASTRAPKAGRWIWRGTDLRMSNAEPDVWDSRFVTLAFEVYAPR
jgi:hypothetical protein